MPSRPGASCCATSARRCATSCKQWKPRGEDHPAAAVPWPDPAGTVDLRRAELRRETGMNEMPGALAADLEIGLHRRGESEWTVETRFTAAERDTIGTDVLGGGPADLDLARLRDLRHGGPMRTQEYGQVITAGLFSSPTVREEFAKARTAAASGGTPLRVRLLISPSAPELHPLRWETLLDPGDGSPLLTDSNVLFSRYLTTTDWRPVRMRLRGELRALIVVANPRDLEEYLDPGDQPESPGRELAPVDVEGETQRARAALDPIRPDVLAGSGRPTLSNLVGRLRDGYDV